MSSMLHFDHVLLMNFDQTVYQKLKM